MEADVKSEIGNMLAALEGKEIESEQKEEEIVEEEVKEEKEEVVEEEVKEEVKEEEVIPNEKEVELANLRAEVESLKKAKEPEKKEEVKEEVTTFEETDFIGDLDLDDLTRDKTAFNKILNAVYSKGVNDARKLTSEKVLLSIPDIVKNNITLLSQLKEASDKFYTENKDLEPFKRVVAATFEEVAAANPGKKYDELMKLVAPEARKKLDLHKKVDADKKKDPPRLPQKDSNKRNVPNEKPNTSALQNELDEMNKTIRR
jgi:hypothetical protein